PDGLDDCAQSLRRDDHRRLRRRRGSDPWRLCDRGHRDFRGRLYLCAVQGRLRFPGAHSLPRRPPARNLRRAGGGKGLTGMGSSAIGHIAYALVAFALVALAATVKTDGYVANILMQAATYAIAVFGLSVVLGLCGQINLAQAAFFGLGAYAVGIGTSDYHVSYWLCLAGGCVIALLAGALLGASTLRLGGHYLAMVTISFQQIVTLVMINTIWLTHGPDGVPRIGRPDLFQSSQSYLAFC